MNNKKINTRVIKVPWIRNESKIFGAFEWNAYVLGMYEDIFKEINNKYGWKIQYGAKHILTVDKKWKKKIKPKDIVEFIDRNKQFYDIFVEGISSCDLFIADITNHNPNVLLELGVAIQLNKNILIVTSQDIKNLPFDIRGLEAKKYESKQDLQELIDKEIEMYTLIKEQTFKPGEFINIKRYLPLEKGILVNNDAVQITNIPRLKNLRLKVDFKFIFSVNHDYDWFGINLRTQGPSRYNCELALIRYSGQTRSLTWQGKRPEKDGRKIINFKPKDLHTFEILINENMLTGWIDGKQAIKDHAIEIEDFGEVWVGSYEHHRRLEKPEYADKDTYLQIEYSNIQIIDLGTTANLF